MDSSSKVSKPRSKLWVQSCANTGWIYHAIKGTGFEAAVAETE